MSSNNPKNVKIQLVHGQYRVCCGYSIGDDGKQKNTIFYLGADYDAANVKRNLIRAEFQKWKSDGVKSWPPDVLLRLADQGIVGQSIARRVVKQTVKADVADLMSQDVNEGGKRMKPLRDYRNGNGIVEAQKFADYMFTLIGGEVFDPEGELLVRKALQKLKKTDPLKAMNLMLEFWKLKETLGQIGPTTAVQVNIGDVSARDDSAERLKRIMAGEAGDEPSDSDH